MIEKLLANLSLSRIKSHTITILVACTAMSEYGCSSMGSYRPHNDPNFAYVIKDLDERLNQVTQEQELLPNQILNTLRINYNFNSFLTRKGNPTLLRRTSDGKLKLYYPTGAYLVSSHHQQATLGLIVSGPHPIEPDIAFSMRHHQSEINPQRQEQTQRELASYLALPSEKSSQPASYSKMQTLNSMPKSKHKPQVKSQGKSATVTKEVLKITSSSNALNGEAEKTKHEPGKVLQPQNNQGTHELTSDQKALQKLAHTP